MRQRSSGCAADGAREKGMGVMGVSEKQAEGTVQSGLRVYRGDENESNGVENNVFRLRRDAVASEGNAEMEAFWAGRNYANRRSARIAA
jgi:hypothetical protein